MWIPKILVMQLYIVATSGLHGQILNSNIQYPVNLDDDVRIILIPSAQEPNQFYYIPETIQISMKKAVPEASLLLYRDKDNGIEGGIMHVLLTWGLTYDQENVVRRHLSMIDSAAVLMGGAELVFSDDGFLKLESDTPMNSLLRRGLTNPIRISPQSTSKTAASFRFTGNDAAELHKAIHSKQKDRNNFSIDYQYRIREEAGYVSVGKMKKGTMHASINQWIKTLVKYNLIKYTSV